MALQFGTRRVVQEFKEDASSGASEQKGVYTATVQILENEFVQYIGFSFSGDKKEKAIGAMVESFTVYNDSTEMETMTGHTLMVRNALRGLRGTYDMSHNRMHTPLLPDISMDHAGELKVVIKTKQYSAKELKEMFSAESNADLFDAPELFVATRRRGGYYNLGDGLNRTQITPISKHQEIVPFVNMTDKKNFTILLGGYMDLIRENTPTLNESDRVVQLWFTYDVLNIQTTSSMFSKLELLFHNEVVHTYSSPVQLQILDKELFGLFSSNANARSVQEKYLTITFQDTTVTNIENCELRFTLHDQFYKDYTNWINEDKNKLVEIKDAVIQVHFGFVWHKKQYRCRFEQ